MAVLKFDREALRAALPGLEAAAAASTERFRRPGRDARAAGEPMSANPFLVGSFAWSTWLEGWSGTECPRRCVVDGAFNMTPAAEIQRRAAWLADLGVELAAIGEAVAMMRRGYTPEALGGLN